jgi:hypothetical protein
MSSPPFSPLLKNILLQTDDAALVLPGIQVIYCDYFLVFSFCNFRSTAFYVFFKEKRVTSVKNLFEGG